MKKFKALIGVIALSSLLIGAGYAGWTETVTLANTVETGKFCVKIADVEVVSKGQIGSGGLDDLIKTKYENTDDGHKVTFDIENLHPGAEVKYEVSFENLGSIDAIIDGVDVSLGMESRKTETSNLVDKLEIYINDQTEAFSLEELEQLEVGIKNQLGTIGYRNEKQESIMLTIRMKEGRDKTEAYTGFDHHNEQSLPIIIDFTWGQANLSTNNAKKQ